MDHLYDKLSDEMKGKLAELIRKKNIDHTNYQAELIYSPNTFYTRYAKRWFDVFFAAIALVITLPINIVIAVITYFDVGRPIFFSQQRTGKDGKQFRIIKFRNMRNTVDESGILLPADKRVTKWGKIVRRSSLDELLNFISVLKGDMSLIGPRPLPSTYDVRYSERHLKRFVICPGLECPPHDIKHFNGSWQDRLENDIWYVKNVSFLTDCKMLLTLLKVVFDKKSTQRRGNAKNLSFMGYDENGKAIGLDEVPEEYIKEVLEQYNIKVV